MAKFSGNSRSSSDSSRNSARSYGDRQPRGTKATSRDRKSDSYTQKGSRLPERGKHSNVKPSLKPAGAIKPQDDLCWGRNPVMTLLQERPSLCGKVYLLETMEDEELKESIARYCAESDIPLEFVSRSDLDRLTSGTNNQGVAARIKPVPPANLDDIIDAINPDRPAMVVIMDHCQDPHNLGAVIRTAEIAGASCVVCQNDRSASVNGTVIKTSAGAAFRLPVSQVVNVARAIRNLKEKGFWVVGLDHRTDEAMWDNPMPDRLALVVGAEGEGISPLVAKNCDKLVKIPMAGRTGNLNASVAAALGMFEWLRTNGSAVLSDSKK